VANKLELCYHVMKLTTDDSTLHY